MTVDTVKCVSVSECVRVCVCVCVCVDVSVLRLMWSSLCIVSLLCLKARVDFPWEGVGRVCVFVRVSVCVSVTLGLSQLFPSCGLCSLWGHSTYSSLSISGDCHFFEVSPSTLLGEWLSSVEVFPWSCGFQRC